MSSSRQKLRPRELADPVITNVNPLPRGVMTYFTPREWRLVAGFEVSEKIRLHVDIYLGLGPIMVRFTW